VAFSDFLQVSWKPERSGYFFILENFLFLLFASIRFRWAYRGLRGAGPLPGSNILKKSLPLLRRDIIFKKKISPNIRSYMLFYWKGILPGKRRAVFVPDDSSMNAS